MYGVIIIGTGVSGATSARELSRYRVNACVLEREEDVCCGTSKANSTIVHIGYDTTEGPLTARLNVEGNQIMPELTRELGFPFNPCGSFVVCLDEESLPDLRALYERGVKNGAKDLEIITNKVGVKEMRPNLTDEVADILYTPTAGIVCPFNLNIALVENAHTSGVGFKFNTEVTDVRRIEGGWTLETNQGIYETRYVANTTGVHANEFHNMISGTKIHITPRRGDYCLLGKSTGNHVSRIIFVLPGKYGKGVPVSPAVHGNLIAGPATIDIEDKEATATVREGLNESIAKAEMNVRGLPARQIITSFAGLRVHEDRYEFIIRELGDAPGFVDCARIGSPGLISCPAIERMVAGVLKKKLELEPNTQLSDSQKGILDPDTLTKEEQAELIKQNPAYGGIICRCEMVAEGEILGAIHRPLGARSLDDIKRRTRAGIGCYQAGLCTPRLIELLHRELGLSMTEITKAGGDSELVVGTNKNRTQKGAHAG